MAPRTNPFPPRAARQLSTLLALFIHCTCTLLILAGCATTAGPADLASRAEPTPATASDEPANEVAAQIAVVPASESPKEPDRAEPAESEPTPEAFLWREIPVERHWEPGVHGGTLVLPVMERLATLNPMFESDIPGEAEIRWALTSSVVTRDALTEAVIPDLAESWRHSTNLRRIEIKLRDNLQWSDGTPLTAADVVFSINELYLHPDAELLGIEVPETVRDAEVRRTNTQTLTVTTVNPTYDVWELLLRPVLPRHIVEPWLADHIYLDLPALWAANTDLTSLVSCGPFVLTESDWKSTYSLERNPHYHRRDEAGRPLPYLDGVVFRVVETFGELIELLASGNIDMNGHQFVRANLPDVRATAEMVRELTDRDIFVYADRSAPGKTFLAFNMTPVGVSYPAMEEGEEAIELVGVAEPMNSWLNDRRFREALASLIDRRWLARIHERVTVGETSEGATPTYVPTDRFDPENHAYGLPPGEHHGPNYDPARAARLLDTMGLIDRDGDGVREDESGNPVELTMITNEPNAARKIAALALAEDFQRAGLDITAEPMSWDEVMQSIQSADWQLMYLGSTPEFYGPFTSWDLTNIGGQMYLAERYQQSPRRNWETEITSLHERLAAEPRDELASELSREIWRIWYTELPVVPVTKDTFGILTTRPVGNVIRGLREWPSLSLERLYVPAEEP